MHKYKLGQVLTLQAALVGAGDTEGRCLPKAQVVARITHEEACGIAMAYRCRVIRADDVIEQNYRDFAEEELAELPEGYAEEDQRPPVYMVLTPEQFRDRVKQTT
jgi:hypothetical protein